MPIAVIALDFEPLVRLADGLLVRWQTVALVAIVAIGLIAAVLIARREGLRADDLLFIAVAAVPGAVLGGRLGYVLLHLDFYDAHKSAIVDPAQGSLELALAIVGGTVSSAYVAGLLGAPIGRWLRAATVPLLFVLGAGKLAMVLGGSGQGMPVDLPWATAYIGAGPWGSLAPELPSHPAQAYEGIAGLAILVILALALAGGAFRRPDGRLFFVALGCWALARAAIAVTWRDPAVAWGLTAGSLVALAVALGSLAAFIILARRQPRAPAVREVSWPDPEARSRF